MRLYPSGSPFHEVDGSSVYYFALQEGISPEIRVTVRKMVVGLEAPAPAFRITTRVWGKGGWTLPLVITTSETNPLSQALEDVLCGTVLRDYGLDDVSFGDTREDHEAFLQSLQQRHEAPAPGKVS